MTKEEMIANVVSDCLCQRLTIVEWSAKLIDPNRVLTSYDHKSFTGEEWLEILSAAQERLNPSPQTRRHNAITEISEITNRIKSDTERLDILVKFLRDTNASRDTSAEHQGPQDHSHT